MDGLKNFDCNTLIGLQNGLVQAAAIGYKDAEAKVKRRTTKGLLEQLPPIKARVGHQRALYVAYKTAHWTMCIQSYDSATCHKLGH